MISRNCRSFAPLRMTESCGALWRQEGRTADPSIPLRSSRDDEAVGLRCSLDDEAMEMDDQSMEMKVRAGFL